MSLLACADLAEMNARLEAIRALEPGPKRMEWERWNYQLPSNYPPHDALFRQRHALDGHFASGRVTWASIVIANASLFRDEGFDAPASIVYSFDPFLQRNFWSLKLVARRVFELREAGRTKATPLRDACAHITDDYDRSFGAQLPVTLSSGRVVYLSSMFVVRSSLPTPLCGQPLPIVVRPGAGNPAMVLPRHLWLPHRVERWNAAWGPGGAKG